MMNLVPQNKRKIYDLDKRTLHEVARVGRKLLGKHEGHKARLENLNLILTPSMAVEHASTLCPRSRGFPRESKRTRHFRLHLACFSLCMGFALSTRGDYVHERDWRHRTMVSKGL